MLPPNYEVEWSPRTALWHILAIYRVAEKSKPLPIIVKCLIVLKSANEIRFLRQTKEIIKDYNIIRQNYLRDILFDVITMPVVQNSNMRHIR